MQKKSRERNYRLTYETRKTLRLLAAKLVELRKRNKLSKKKIAAALGFSVVTYKAIERERDLGVRVSILLFRLEKGWNIDETLKEHKMSSNLLMKQK